MKKNKKIPVFDIALGEIEKKYINDCLDTSFIGQGPYVKKLEEKFSSFVDCKYGVTTTSGTTALHLACAAIGIKKDDQILVFLILFLSPNLIDNFLKLYPLESSHRNIIHRIL